ncbi:MAG TPA: cysteine peptidase family C39 domain-containing protein [Tepidisphaeraceae bacterium]|nr:cysteine peptidase family C39 domain-containing protein [Tepidisphaeraceae bacterium]
MTSDLIIAIAVMLGLAALVGSTTYALTRRRRAGVAITVAIALLSLTLTQILWARDAIWALRWLPARTLVVYGDWTPLLVAGVIGAGWRLLPGRPARRCVLVVPLAGLTLWHAYAGLFERPAGELHVVDRWQRGICRQSTQTTCGPAAAATLLARYAIRATEPEMAGLCLTTRDGTSLRGICRGLAIKATGMPLRVTPVVGGIDELAAQAPAILSVYLADTEKHDPRFHREWGWAPGVRHVVVLLGRRADGRFEIGDPAMGPEAWDRRALEALWHGDGVRLVREQ